jgi:S1-C subfamily serine protease
MAPAPPPATAAPMAPAAPIGYGQPYGYGPQPYDYPQQQYGVGQGYGSNHYYAGGPGYLPGAYGAPVPPPAIPTTGSGGRRWALIAGCAAIAAALAIGVGVATDGSSTTNGTALDGSTGTPSTSQPTNGTNGGIGQFPFGNTGNSGTGNSGLGGSGNSGTGGSGNSGSGTTGTTATAKQEVGIVDIDTVLGYQHAEAAGTGMVLDSTGDILTNNHVIDGATKIQVTIVATGKTYTATVVGTAPSEDIAVIHLTNASGLTVANLGNSSSVKVGDSVTGVGNAGGVGGVPSAAAGTVTALNQKITASDETGDSSEKLTGVIATNAPIKAGDSGGPLYNSSDQVVGIDTAASSSGQASGYAIPINHALDIAKEIEHGVETSSIHIGYPAFLGVSVENAASGVGLVTVYQGGAAANAGLTAGDVITAVDGTKVSTLTKLKSVISARQPGAKVSVSYLDTSGTSHTVTVTLDDGPAD